MKYQVTHTTQFQYSEPVPVGHNILRLAPRSLPHQTVSRYQLSIQPEPIELSRGIDFFGNEITYFSIDDSHRQLTVTSNSEVVLSEPNAIPLSQTPPWESVIQRVREHRDDQSLAALRFTFESRYVKTFPALFEYGKEVFTAGKPVGEAVLALTTKIFEDFEFDNAATNIHTTIAEVFEQRRGVCQDFAHLQIACLRSLGLPARYVSGYLRTIPPPGKPRLVGADASHAWVSVYCDTAGWIDFDPTNHSLVGTDYVTVAWGRDYQDVCPVQGVISGGGQHKMHVSVDVEPQ